MADKNLELEFKSWYEEPLGISLLTTEKKYFDKILDDLSGNYLLKFNLLNYELLNKCKIPYHIYAVQNLPKIGSNLSNKTIIQCNFAELPFLSESIDIVILSHILEFSQNPHSILEGVYHTLAPNGKIVIVGFNPYSLLGAIKYFKCKKLKTAPWCGRFIGQRRIKNWLTNLGFSIDLCHTFYFRPPINNSHALKWLYFMEKTGKILYPPLGACYMLIAVKIIAALPSLEEKSVIAKRVPA